MLTKTWNKTQWAGFAGPGVAALIFVLSAIACAAPGAAPLDPPTTAPSDTPTPSPIPTSTPTATPTATATATSTPTPTLTPTTTPSPTITPTPTPKVLLTDTFDGNDNDWTIGKGEASDAEIVDGSMVVTVSRGSWSRYVEPDLSNPDVDMTVETTLIANSSQETDLGYGLVCRSGRSGVNTFELSPDGRYAIWHSVKKDWIMLANGRDPTIVLPPPATNTIRVICAGDRLTLIVNGKLLAVVLDNDLTSGFAGFVVGTGKNTPHVAVKFDNLVIRQPDSGSITRLDVSIGARPEERP